MNGLKNHHLDLVRVTEAGAIAAADWVGRGDKESADKGATTQMRDRLNSIDFSAEIAIGEGIKDGSYGLFEGEKIGLFRDSKESQFEIAVDPIEGTTPTATGGYEAMSVIALGQKGAFYKTPCFYMNKIAVGPRVAKKVRVSLANNVTTNVSLVAAALQKDIQRVTVCCLDRPRHADIVDELRKIGCRVQFITDCDVSACIACCQYGSGIDMYIGIGGSPESVLSAAAMKCMGGYLQCQEWDSKTGLPVSPTLLGLEDLAKGPVIFCATGITDGKLLKGVNYENGPITHTLAMRSESGTIRRITTEHGN
jgi:fructose-1,6-bisphosphatase II